MDCGEVPSLQATHMDIVDESCKVMIFDKRQRAPSGRIEVLLAIGRVPANQVSHGQDWNEEAQRASSHLLPKALQRQAVIDDAL